MLVAVFLVQVKASDPLVISGYLLMSSNAHRCVLGAGESVGSVGDQWLPVNE